MSEFLHVIFLPLLIIRKYVCFWNDFQNSKEIFFENSLSKRKKQILFSQNNFLKKIFCKDSSQLNETLFFFFVLFLFSFLLSSFSSMRSINDNITIVTIELQNQNESNSLRHTVNEVVIDKWTTK